MTKRAAFESIINILSSLPNSSYTNEIEILKKELHNLDTRNAASAKLRAKKSESKAVLRNDIYNIIKSQENPVSIDNIASILNSEEVTPHQIAYQLRLLKEAGAIDKKRTKVKGPKCNFNVTVYFIPTAEEEG